MNNIPDVIDVTFGLSWQVLWCICRSFTSRLFIYLLLKNTEATFCRKLAGVIFWITVVM